VLSQFTLPDARYVRSCCQRPLPEALSTLRTLPDGVKAGSLAAALANDSSLLEKNLAQHAQTGDNAFAALNTAFFHDGAFIYVPPGQALPEPVQFLFISTATEAGATTHRRNLIIADRGAQLTLIESYVSTANAAYFTNAVTEFVVGDSAIVEHLKFQDESLDAYHVATLHADLGQALQFLVPFHRHRREAFAKQYPHHPRRRRH
jgi:Fe-S cluster assembly protein SufD